MIAKPIRLMFV